MGVVTEKEWDRWGRGGRDSGVKSWVHVMMVTEPRGRPRGGAVGVCQEDEREGR